MVFVACCVCEFGVCVCVCVCWWGVSEVFVVGCVYVWECVFVSLLCVCVCLWVECVCGVRGVLCMCVGVCGCV